MTSTPDTPNPDGADLEELREEIDELKNTPVEELVDPKPAGLLEAEPTPHPTDAIGSEKWDEPASEETLEE